MRNTLVCWIGNTDLSAARGEEKAGLGPIAQAVQARTYDEIVLLTDFPQEKVQHFLDWLTLRTTGRVTHRRVQLSGPTNFGDIYTAARKVVGDLKGARALTFHLSPGTPAMAAVWIILSKTRFAAELIESSREQGVRTASVPFDISAEFIPDLLKKPDDELQRLSAGLPPEATEFGDIIHRSAVMKRLVGRARQVAVRSIPVLIEGESGSGKEMLARAIHRTSPRAKGPFKVVNCGAIPSELVESELFGHKKGAFTGSLSDRVGYFEAADGGTLFLDEIGELPLPVQVKLLRVIQESEVTRIGETTPRKIDIRLISATNRVLTEEIVKGSFREDLFYRLAVAVLKVPALREREGDVGLLVDRLLEQVNDESRTEPGFRQKKISAGAKNLLLAHAWPGNVRELLNTLRRAAVWATGDTITVQDMDEAIIPSPRNTDPKSSLMNRSIEEGVDLSTILGDVARDYIQRALDASNGNKTKAAALLGMANYQTLTNWMKRHGLES